MNNPFQLFQAIRNPQQFIQNMMGDKQFANNPILNNTMQMLQNGDKEGLKELCENLCKSNGTSIEEMTNKIESNIAQFRYKK